MGEHKRALPEIVEKQAGKHDGKPPKNNWPSSEMTEVDIESLGSGDRKKDRPDCEESQFWL